MNNHSEQSGSVDQEPCYRVSAPGPTPVPERAREAMSMEPGYHRTDEFSEVIHSVVSSITELLGEGLTVVPVTASGTGAMEMALWNLVDPDEQILVVNSGKFGNRWAQMARKYGCHVREHQVERGRAFQPERILEILQENPGISAVCVTSTETSTLVRHPVEKLSRKLRDQSTIILCDAISTVGAEPFYPTDVGVNAVVMGAQKGLMGPPGLSFLAVDEFAVSRAEEIDSDSFYFDLSTAVSRYQLDHQTPWTPPMQLLRAQQISLEIMFDEGPETVFARHRRLAGDCRKWLEKRNLKIFSNPPAVSGTAMVVPRGLDGVRFQQELHQKYNCYIPGGQKELEGKILRIGHLGYVFEEDLHSTLQILERALSDREIL